MRLDPIPQLMAGNMRDKAAKGGRIWFKSVNSPCFPHKTRQMQRHFPKIRPKIERRHPIFDPFLKQIHANP